MPNQVEQKIESFITLLKQTATTMPNRLEQKLDVMATILTRPAVQSLVQLEQKFDISKIGPNRWRVFCLIGRTIVFYGEAGSETATFTVTNEFAEADLGKWRAVDRARHMIVGFGGKANISPKAGGGENEVQIQLDGVVVML